MGKKNKKNVFLSFVLEFRDNEKKQNRIQSMCDKMRFIPNITVTLECRNVEKMKTLKRLTTEGE